MTTFDNNWSAMRKKIILIFVFLQIANLTYATASVTDTLKVIKNNSFNYDKKFDDLQAKIDDNQKSAHENIISTKQDIKDILNIYVWSICGIFTLITVAINFFGKNAIKKRVEEIIAETAQGHVDVAILSLLNSKITTELIAELIKEKSENDLSVLLKAIETKGETTINQFKLRGNEVLNSMILSPLPKSNGNNSSQISDEEINHFNEAVRSDEYFQMALSAKDKKVSIELYKNVIELNPKSFAAYNNIGVSYNAINKYEDAIKNLDVCIRINPNFTFAYSNRALSYNQLNQLDKSLEDAEKAIQLDATNDWAYAIKGNVLTKQNKFIEAEDALNTAINLSPNSPDALFHRGFFYEERQLFEKSEEDYLNSEKNGFPNKAMLYNNMAVLYRRQRQFSKAIEYVGKAREQDPSYPNLDGTLALIYADQGADEEFYKHINIALEKGCQVWNYLSDYGFDKYRQSTRLKKLIDAYKTAL